MKNVFLKVFLFTFLAISEASPSVKIRDFDVPKTVLEGERVLLKCGFDNVKDSNDRLNLISLNWYKDEVPFFIFKPHPEYGKFLSSSYITYGSSYYYEKSSDNVESVTVTLPSSSTYISGVYRCQLRFTVHVDKVERANTTLPKAFELSHSREQILKVIGLKSFEMTYPKSPPAIESSKESKNSNFSLGEQLELTCHSDKDFPAPRIDWHFVGNGGELFALKWDELIPYPIKIQEDGFEKSSLGLKINLNLQRMFICTTTFDQSSVLSAKPIVTSKSYKINYEGITFKDETKEPVIETGPTVDSKTFIIIVGSLCGTLLLCLLILIILSILCYKKGGCFL